MSTITVHVSVTAKHLMIRALILFVVGVLVGFMINFFSPQATWTMGPEERIWFWILLCLVGGVGIFVCDLILTFLQVQWPGWAKALLQSICGTVAVLIPLYLEYHPENLPGYSTTVLFVWIVMILILVGAYIVGLKFLKTDSNQDAVYPGEEVGEKNPAKILNRLPVHLQSSELYALSAEDHYVRVHTSKGDDMILMRFSDAILETGDVEGVQVHRSWWVAQAAIDNIKSKGRSAEITLKNTGKAPVSRNALKTIRKMGWL